MLKNLTVPVFTMISSQSQVCLAGIRSGSIEIGRRFWGRQSQPRSQTSIDGSYLYDVAKNSREGRKKFYRSNFERNEIAGQFRQAEIVSIPALERRIEVCQKRLARPNGAGRARKTVS
jgi:hypothetical protein